MVVYLSLKNTGVDFAAVDYAIMPRLMETIQ
jgi:hypothetical protein